MLSTLLSPVLLSAALLAPGGESAPASAHGSTSFTLKAAHLRLYGNKVIADGVVKVEDGKVTYAGDAKGAGELGSDVIEHEGWASAGLVAARTWSGLGGEGLEPKRPFTAEARAADVVALGHADFARARAEGITTMVVALSPANVASGITTVVKTDGHTTLARDGHLQLGLSSQALRTNRFPTSYAAALELIETELAKPTGVWERVGDGELPVYLDALSRDEISRALDLATKHKLKGALLRAPLAGELAGEIKKSGLAVVVGPFGIGTEERVLASVVSLGKERVPVAFGLEAPAVPEASLRLSAAMCVRAGLDPALAWEGMTTTAAAVAGVASRVGKLAAGCDADIVLWSADPLELASKVESVFIAGVRQTGGAH